MRVRQTPGPFLISEPTCCDLQSNWAVLGTSDGQSTHLHAWSKVMEWEGRIQVLSTKIRQSDYEAPGKISALMGLEPTTFECTSITPQGQMYAGLTSLSPSSPLSTHCHASRLPKDHGHRDMLTGIQSFQPWDCRLCQHWQQQPPIGCGCGLPQYHLSQPVGAGSRRRRLMAENTPSTSRHLHAGW